MAEITSEMIRSQVDVICSTPPFRRSDKLNSFLKYVVDEYLNDRSDYIKAYSIAVDVFNRAPHFNPQTDSIVRVYGSKLRRELKNYYLENGNHEQVLIKLKRGSYVPVIENHKDILDFESNSVFESEMIKEKEKVEPSIAVVTFKCHSNHESCNFIANGLTEEIIIGLGLFKALKVKGPLLRKNLNNDMLSVLDIGKIFDVGFVLDGTLRRLKNQLRVNVRLIETKNGQQLWGNILECNLKSDSISQFEESVIRNTISTIADNYGVISRQVRKKLKANFGVKPNTYEAILKYYHHFIVLTAESQIDATTALEAAVKKEPGNALATAMLGDLIASTYQFGYSDSIELLQRGRELGKRSIALDPNCQAAHFLMGLIHFMEGNKTGSFKEFDKALELNPNNAHYIAAISLHLAMTGEWGRGIILMDMACEMNPHYPGWHHLVYFMNFYRQKEYDLALQEANDFNTPDFYMHPLINAAVLGQLGDKAKGEEIENLLSLMPDFMENGRSRMRRFFFSDENLDMIWEGLVKAGINNF